MADVAIRLALVAGALAVALGAAWLLRRRSDQPVRSVGDVQLAIGIHLFTSTACGTCRSARKTLTAAVGSGGFTEHVWEEEPGVFAEIGVDAVPATLIVADDRSGTLYPGKPGKALAAL